MATTRVSVLSLSQRMATVCRPRLHLGVRCVASVRPLRQPGRLACAKYSTTAPERPSLAPKIERGGYKLFKNADDAVADLQSGSTILSSGFGLCGVAGMLPSNIEVQKLMCV